MKKFAIFFIVLAIIWGCGSTKKQLTPNPTEQTLKKIPEWYTNVPKDPNYLFASASATSLDLDFATRKAAQIARAEIARQLETKLEGMVKGFTEEVGTGENAEFLTQFTEVSKTVTSRVLNGSQIVKQEIQQDGQIYRAYVLMQMPIGEANAAFLEQLKKQQNLYTRFRASQAFKELEEEVRKYEQFKKEQAGK